MFKHCCLWGQFGTFGKIQIRGDFEISGVRITKVLLYMYSMFFYDRSYHTYVYHMSLYIDMMCEASLKCGHKECHITNATLFE